MTADEWDVEVSVGTMMEALRRYQRMSAWTVGRKCRLAACSIFRLVPEIVLNPGWRRVIERTEFYVDRLARFGEIEEAIQEADEIRFEYRSARDWLRCLNNADPYFAAYRSIDSAGRILEHFGGGNWLSLNEHSLLVVRDIFGNPFRPTPVIPEWRTTTAAAIANGMYDARDFGPMPLLADALQDAGCEVPEIIDHCRGPGPHVRGCWVVDGVLGKA